MVSTEELHRSQQDDLKTLHKVSIHRYFANENGLGHIIEMIIH